LHDVVDSALRVRAGRAPRDPHRLIPGRAEEDRDHRRRQPWQRLGWSVSGGAGHGIFFGGADTALEVGRPSAARLVESAMMLLVRLTYARAAGLRAPAPRAHERLKMLSTGAIEMNDAVRRVGHIREDSISDEVVLGSRRRIAGRED
jgi:hypothetical protein